MSWNDNIYGHYGQSQGGFPNRSSGWKKKSDNASRREQEAKSLFDAFYAKCSAMDTTRTFPVTQEIVGPEVHLTTLCFAAFRKYVTAKGGCKVHRREISPAEKMSLPKQDIRRVKQYAISVTVPIHPLKLVGENNKAQKEQAAKARAEEPKSVAVMEVLNGEEQVKKRAAFELAVLDNQTQHLAFLTEKRSVVDASECGNYTVNKENAGPLAKKQKPYNYGIRFVSSVPTSALLGRLNEYESERKEAIRNAIAKKRNELLQLEQKQSKLNEEVDDKCNRLRSIILSSSNTGGQISQN